MGDVIWLIIGVVLLLLSVWILFRGGAESIYGRWLHDVIAPDAPMSLGVNGIKGIFWIIFVVSCIWFAVGVFVPSLRFWIIGGWPVGLSPMNK